MLPPNGQWEAVGNNSFLALAQPKFLEVIRIAPDGRIFWHGREVESDADFRAAMMDLATKFQG